ncbi:hypothetical protein [Paraflavitalea speifideaquila]|uniref:hypothetical protein n=1 Tax=Paraflavitalea speifideaquila TaxID=3076558 RepID=UPI0028E5E05B|nr:hypothetical protein [Paraflavitalea speifideiaquila]
MYTASARHRIYAIDGKTGQQVWGFDPFDGGPGGGLSWCDLLGRRRGITSGSFSRAAMYCLPWMPEQAS